LAILLIYGIPLASVFLSKLDNHVQITETRGLPNKAHQMQLWEKFESERVTLKLKQEIVGISGTTYYRYKKILKKNR
jgi:hypothetical protein